MATPAWFDRIAFHPAYDGRVVLVDTNIFSRMAVDELWDVDLSFLVNSPPKMLKIKIGFQVWEELVGPYSERMPRELRQKQLRFVDSYRRSGKIVVDQMPVSLFSTGDLTIFQKLNAALVTARISKEDARIVADGMVNHIALMTGDERLWKALMGAINNRGVLSILKSQNLPTTLDDILIYYL